VRGPALQNSCGHHTPIVGKPPRIPLGILRGGKCKFETGNWDTVRSNSAFSCSVTNRDEDYLAHPLQKTRTVPHRQSCLKSKTSSRHADEVCPASAASLRHFRKCHKRVPWRRVRALAVLLNLLLQQNRYRTILICHCQIEFPIAVEIRRCQHKRAGPSRVRRTRCRGERAIAVAK
jgi:hypothetical protein